MVDDAGVLELDIDVDCPECGYVFWIRSSELTVQLTVVCPCCRVRVRLVNPDGSASTIDRQIDRIVEDTADALQRHLQQTIDRWFR